MYSVPEAAIAGLITRDDSFRAVEAVFASMACGRARNFPVIREALGHANALHGFKSGFDRNSLALGLKSGGFWPGNAARGLTNHPSTIFLFDADTGQIKAVIGGNLLTALRTAAASALSIRHLARPDAEGETGRPCLRAEQRQARRYTPRSRRQRTMARRGQRGTRST